MSKEIATLKQMCQTDSGKAIGACHEAMRIANALPGGFNIGVELYRRVGTGELELIRPGIFKPTR